ncbi:hypothetical protein ABS755_05170 [Castellaniella sp. FW104-16D08]|uniref:hypothetical protein n=1 Tax=unclassified Castellaniella TaxID=2617606 RepID=UPI0033145FDC
MASDKQIATPVVLFLFKRADKPLQVIRRIAEVQPPRLYLLSDGGRDAKEHDMVLQCRALIEREITWDCEVIRRYQEQNIGVYRNIAGGAKWVFKREKVAIFLEDDNLPEITFFKFCEEMLLRYSDDARVLWVCGTNYLENYSPEDDSSYVFTKNMMPCGWASWAEKFNKFYDGELKLWQNPYIRRRLKFEYLYGRLYYQDKYNLDYEISFKEENGMFYSWDYQMAFSMRAHNVYAIAPKYNQICNIGADLNATHGGNDLGDVMVDRLCGLKTKSLEFPLKHPATLLIDRNFELKVAKIILNPRFFSVRSIVSRFVRKVLGVPFGVTILNFFLKKK